MKKSEQWIDVHTAIPDHFEIVYIKLKDEPDKTYTGCYIGVGAWSCLGRTGVVMSREIDGWMELPLGIDPFENI